MLEEPPTWKQNEEAFEAHFGIPYADFVEMIMEDFDPKLRAKYERTVLANEEAAILWAIREGCQRDFIHLPEADEADGGQDAGGGS